MGEKNVVKNEKRRFHTIRNLCFVFQYLHKYVPGYILMNLIETLCDVFWNLAANVLFVKYLFEAIENKNNFIEILVATLCMTTYKLVLEFIKKWTNNVYYPRTKLRLHEAMQGELYMKARTLDLSCYEDPLFFNDYIWAMKESDARIVKIMSDIKGFLNCTLTLSGMITLLAGIDWRVVLAVTLSTCLGSIIRYKTSEVQYQKASEMNPIIRRRDYYKRVFYLREYAKELRFGEMGELVQNKYADTMDNQIKCIKKYATRILKLSFLSNLVTNCLFDVIITGYLIIRYAIDTTFSLGDFSASINSVWKMFVQISTITNYITLFKEHSLYLDKFTIFLNYSPRIVSGTEMASDFDTLQVNHVSFSYDQLNKQLKDVSLSIKKGEKVAFVGCNGAGKTTLIKTLLRLYEVSDGSILYNGRDIREYDLNSYREHIGTVFQDYKLFAATIGENVLGKEYLDMHEQKVLSALKLSAFDKIEKLPNGLKTILTREFDDEGIYLSEGEKQKIAIARAIAKEQGLIIMDEPSSALDPVAEYELNQSIMENTGDKTVIFISHRLATTRMADKIYMFSGGRIVEQGSHDELMSQNGKYAEMYHVQAKKYNSSEIE